MTFLEVKNSVFNIYDENKIFSNTTPGYWSSRGGALLFHKLQYFLKLRSQNDIKLHVEEVTKSCNLIKIGDGENKLTDLDTHQKEIIEEQKNIE